MKKGQIYTANINKVSFPDKGIAVCEEETESGKSEYEVLVKGVLPGQKVSIRISKKKNKKIEGRVLEVIEKSPLEDADHYCEHFGACGGCSYLSMSYENQKKLKLSQVTELLNEVIPGFTLEGILNGPIDRYRNKMEFTFGDEYKDGPMSLGMHRKNSFYDIVNLSDCRIVPKDMNDIRIATLEFMKNISSMTYYNRNDHTGVLRHLVVRRSTYTGELLINLVTTSQIKDLGTGLLDEYKKYLLNLELEGNIAGLLHTINDSVADTVAADTIELLYGKDYIIENLLGLEFKITPFSFFQTNSKGAGILYDKVREYVGDTKDKVIFDLYSGTGTIAQIVSPVAKKVVGVEIVKEAVEAARINAGLNNIDNCEFIADDVLKALDNIQDKPDVIILDPPRDGINPKALTKILAYGVDEIVYISCKPTSLVRDLKVFLENGYVVDKGCCVDMFPGTVHVETVCLLSNRKADAKVHIDVDLEDYYRIKDAQGKDGK